MAGFGAGGGNRTLTGGDPHGILSPARLPVSPLRRSGKQNLQYNAQPRPGEPLRGQSKAELEVEKRRQAAGKSS